MASDRTPFYLELDNAQFKEFARSVPLLEDELLMLESYAAFARDNDTLSFSTARVTDSLLARGQEQNIQKLKSLPNVRRLIAQTAYTLRDKKFIDIETEGGEILRIRLIDPAAIFIAEYYEQMQSNSALPFPDDEMVKKYTVSANTVDIPLAEIASGSNHRLKDEKRLIFLRLNDISVPVCVTAATIDAMLEACYMKLKNTILTAAQNRLGEDLVKDMQHIMPQKTTSVDRIGRILSHQEVEIPLYFVNLANRLAAYFTVDKEKKGMLTLIQAARIIEAFKGYEAWLESEKNNEERLRDNARKLLNMMADFPALLNRNDIVQKIVKGTSGLEVMASLLNTDEIENVVQEMLAEFTVFQSDERELLPALLKFRLDEEDFFIHRESLLIFFESERKRVRAELDARFRKMWYALMLKNESRSAMEFDEFFAEDIAKYVKNHEPVFSALLVNPQAIINAFHCISRHPVSANLQEKYFIIGNRIIFKPIHVLLELNRKDIFARVRSELPFLFRYPFLRWLANLFGLVREPSPALEPEKTDTKGPDTPQVRNTDWHRVLAMVETRLIGEKNAAEMIRKFSELWNIKLGDAHKQLHARVDSDINAKAKRLFAMTRKLPEITQSFMAAEVSNAAMQIVRKYGNDAADTRALNNYAQLSLLEQLKII